MSECIISRRGYNANGAPPPTLTLKTVTYTSNVNWVVPNHEGSINVILCGGGGGGCLTNNRYGGYNYNAYCGGGGGWINTQTFSNLRAKNVISIYIGDGGDGGSYDFFNQNNPTSGGSSSFGSYLSANGGEGAGYYKAGNGGSGGGVFSNNTFNRYASGINLSPGIGFIYGGGGWYDGNGIFTIVHNHSNGGTYGGGGGSYYRYGNNNRYPGIEMYPSDNNRYAGDGGTYGGGGGVNYINCTLSNGRFNFSNSNHFGRGGTYGGNGGLDLVGREDYGYANYNYEVNAENGTNTMSISSIPSNMRGWGYSNWAGNGGGGYGGNGGAYGGGGGGYGGQGGWWGGGGGGYGRNANGGWWGGGGGGYFAKGGNNGGGGAGYGQGGNQTVTPGYGGGGGGKFRSGGRGVCVIQYYVWE